jgi:hypothetical protein
MYELSIIKAHMREKNNPKGYVIASLRGVVNDHQQKGKKKGY